MNKSKTEILASALQCFIENGVENTTIADIREHSGVSVGSIYHHFGNKDGIVAALFLTGVNDHSAQQEQALEHATNAEEGVKTIVCCYINWINENPDWARFVFRYRSLVEHSAKTEQEKEQRKAHFSRLRDWFSPYIENQQIKKLPFEVYHALIIGPSQDFALRWLAGRTKTELVSHRELYAEAAWQAIKERGL
jgi:AcrR family transcriptional regulator